MRRGREKRKKKREEEEESRYLSIVTLLLNIFCLASSLFLFFFASAIMTFSRLLFLLSLVCNALPLTDGRDWRDGERKRRSQSMSGGREWTVTMVSCSQREREGKWVSVTYVCHVLFFVFPFKLQIEERRGGGGGRGGWRGGWRWGWRGKKSEVRRNYERGRERRGGC